MNVRKEGGQRRKRVRTAFREGREVERVIWGEWVLSCAGVLSSGGCWETNESSRHLVHTGDCLSIQIAVFRAA